MYRCALGVQLLIIYIDAGWGKLTSPDAAWSVGAEVGALDTYMRHTPAGRCVRWLLGGTANPNPNPNPNPDPN